MKHSRGTKLLDPGLAYPQRQANLAPSQLFVIVEGHHQPLLLGKIRDRFGQPLNYFSSHTAKEWIILGSV